jgi:plastocyanin
MKMNKAILIVIALIGLLISVEAAISVNPANPSPGEAVVFSLVDVPSMARVVSWSFGDGTVREGNNKTITHWYNQAGTFTVLLRYQMFITGPVLTDTKAVTVTEKRRIEATPAVAAIGQAVRFQAYEFQGDAIRWDFGDGTVVSHGSRDMSHAYSRTGTYQVSARDFGGDYQPIFTTVTVTENRAIAFSPTSPAPGQTVSFQAQNFLSDCVMWDFGDGGGRIRGTRSMTHRFARSGSYRVSAFDNCGDAQAITVTIQVSENRSITYQPASPLSGQAVGFEAHNFQGDCVLWNFGDGTAPVQGTRRISHTFARGGTYRVSARDFCGDAPEIVVSLRVEEGRRIVVNQAPLYTGEPIYFSAQGFTHACIVWDFADGSDRVSGQAFAAHTFKKPGRYRVLAIDDCGRTGAPQAALSVDVLQGKGPQAPFRVSYLTLQFEDGKTSKQVMRGSQGLQALARIKHEGSGTLVVQWLVNGQPQSTQSVPLNFAGETSVLSGLTPALPTVSLGSHRVSLRIVTPDQPLLTPTIEYTVVLTQIAPEPPRVTAAHPEELSPESEALVRLRGERFDTETRFDFGDGIASLGLPQVISETEAEQKIFISRGIPSGPREVTAKNAAGSRTGPGRVIVLGEPQKAMSLPGATPPCPELTEVEVMKIEDLKPSTRHTTGEFKEYGPHILTDRTRLSWTLPGNTAGTVDFFEVAFYAGRSVPSGDKAPILTRRVSGRQRHLASSFELITALKAAVPPPSANRPKPCEGYPSYNKPQADVWWTVRGYQVVDCPWQTPVPPPQSPIGPQNLSQKPQPGDLKNKGINKLAVGQAILGQGPLWPQEVLVAGGAEDQMLNLPDNWTGIDCSEGGHNPKGAISVLNVDKTEKGGGYWEKIMDWWEKQKQNGILKSPKRKKEGGIATSNYVGERFELSGYIDTSFSPLKETGEISSSGSDTSVVFGNIFVDWGDGTIERLKAKAECLPTAFHWLRPENTLKGQFRLEATQHAYKRPKAYKVRVYQLPAGIFAGAPVAGGAIDPEALLDAWGQLSQEAKEAIGEVLGQANPGGDSFGHPDELARQGSDALSSKGPSSSMQVKERDKFKGTNQPGAALASGGGTDLEAAMLDNFSHGVLFFCQEVVITNRQDLCASGPLNLVDVRVSGFPAKNGDQDSGKTPVSPSQQLTAQASLRDQVKQKESAKLQHKNTASTCDEYFKASADIRYFGGGSALDGGPGNGCVEVTWLVDGLKIGDTKLYQGLSSPQRQGLKNEAEQADCSQAILETLRVYSPSLPVQEVGLRTLEVQVKVVASPSNPAMGRYLSEPYLSQSNAASLAPWSTQAGPLQMTPGYGIDDVKEKKVDPYTAHKRRKATEPPLFVSASEQYMVRQAEPGALCNLVFPTLDGDFKISNIEGRLTQTPSGGYSGEGILVLPFSSDHNSNEDYVIPIAINNWRFDPETGLVSDAQIDLDPQFQIQAPGINALVRGVKGKLVKGQKERLNLKLDLELKNKELRHTGNDAGVEETPRWSKTSPLSSEGDWLATDKLDEIILSWSAFRLSSDQVTFDYSKKEHAPQGKPEKWVGVDLGTASFKPYTFDLMADKALISNASGWVVDDSGVVGLLNTGAYDIPFKKGHIRFDNIRFEAKNNSFDAVYQNLDIRVPWLDVNLKGDATMDRSSGEYAVNFSSVNAPSVTKNYGQFSLTASDLRFTSEKNVGWVIRSKTKFQLRSENKTITEFTVPRFFYRFEGYPCFSEKGLTWEQDLGQSTMLGDTRLTLKKVVLTAREDGSQALAITLPSEAYISENPIMPKAATQLDYAVNIGTPHYTGTGPAVTPFTLDVAYPLGNPIVKMQMNPIYSPGSSAQSGGGSGSGPSEGDAAPQSGSGGHSGTRYYGQVNMSMFGAPDVSTQMLLGYQGGKSYFLVRGDIPLGPTGITMTPLPFSLFRLSGGLGYNFPVNSFHTMSIENAQPDMSGETLFMAGMRIGSVDRFTFTMDGITTVKTNGEAGMKFDAWLLTRNQSGDGQFQGFFQFASGAFSGKIWGNLGLLDDLVGFNLGNSAENAALDIHLGNGDWHLYAGKREGPRIAATLLGKNTAEAYLMLGNQVGLAVGGRQNWDLSVEFAYVRGYMDMGLQITPQPSISGEFGAGVEAGICAGVCVSAGVDARVRVSLPPLKMSATATLDLPWPASAITFTVDL